MTAWYKIGPMEATEWVTPTKDGIHLELNEMTGKPQQESWVPIEFEPVREGADGSTLYEVDLPWMSDSMLGMRDRARDKLETILGDYGEFLPATSPEGPLWLYNCTNVLDVLDESRSTLERFDSGRIMWIEHPVFRASKIDHNAVFRISSLRVSATFVSAEVKDLVERTGLTGWSFEPVSIVDD